MPDRVSLFAQSLRAYRARAGTHGRLSQEALAERLGVSVDAIGKYERSLSYIRGDYERRLADRLGWSQAEIAACRADWEAHRLRPARGGYRLLGDGDLDRLYGGSWAGVARAVTQLVMAEMPQIADEFGPDDDLWVPIIERFHMHGACIMQGDRMVGHWGIQFLEAEDRAAFRDRAFTEEGLSPDTLLRPVLPGRYYAYCPVVLIAKGHEAAAPLMLSSAQTFLEDLADRGVLLEGLGAVGVTSEGRQLCRQLGFTRLGVHRDLPGCDVWEMSGAALARSVLGRRSARLRAAYGAGAAGDAPGAA